MTEQVLTFNISDNLFGIDIKLVKEINRNVEFTPVPDAHPNILGLFNMRGQIVTIFDLSQIIGITGDERRKTCICIILKPTDNAQNHVGFVIDKPGDVIDINEDECEPPPANVSCIESDYIRHVVKLEDELLIIVEPNKIFKV